MCNMFGLEMLNRTIFEGLVRLELTYCMLRNFCQLLKVFKIKIFEKYFQEHCRHYKSIKRFRSS